MLKTPLVALCGALTLFAAPAFAQDPNNRGTGHGAASPDVGTGAPSQRGSGSRMDRHRQVNQDNANARRQRAPAPATPEQIKAEAEAVLAAASTACTVSDQRLLGTTSAGEKFYEVACGTTPGYLLIASAPPQAIDCILVDHTAKQAAAAAAAGTEPEAAPADQATPKCELAGNQDIQGFLKAYAAEAGVPCTVDQVAVRGQANSGAVIYEAGCAGADGYWIEKAATGWQKTECLQILAQGATCSFTTKDEQIATVKSWLTGSEAADCNVGDMRLMGQNANGRFIEMTCAGAEGRIIRHNAEFQVQQVYPCATAQAIGGGCTLPGNKPEEA